MYKRQDKDILIHIFSLFKEISTHRHFKEASSSVDEDGLYC
ncbi:hypothetical protein [Clostridium neonatale]|nr:hypothetical protein CNEO3_1970001 [Clostridium neonatale]